jgi:hypothetical protein
MLQSIPDPFDAYGPPPAEDQIFSILPPLSIMNPAPSTPGSLLSTPVQALAPVLPAAWTSANGGNFPDSVSQWADVHSPSSTPPRSVSPPSTLGRRNSVPPSSSTSHHPRKSESKLRTVLSIIDESGHSRATSSTDPPLTVSESSSQQTLNGDPPEEPGAHWETLPYPGADDTTHRNSSLFASESRPPPDPDINPSQISSPTEMPTTMTMT